MSMLDGRVTLLKGDCLDQIRTIGDASIDSVVTDPPYALVSITKRYGKPGSAATSHSAYTGAMSGFMGKSWDTGDRAFAVEFWAEVYRVLKPGGHVVAFSGSRTYHRLAVAIEDSGFEIRDQLMWLYGSGFPKSHDVSKGIDKAAGAERTVIGSATSGISTRKDLKNESGTVWSANTSAYDLTAPATDAAREWQGWGTALKPAHEPIVLARKPLRSTVAANVLEHGTGAINVDGCRVGWQSEADAASAASAASGFAQSRANGKSRQSNSIGKESRDGTNTYDPTTLQGRWPANIIHDGSDEVVGAFPDDAAKFFYSAKADAHDRIGSKHPTVKPVDVMQWLCRLITPKGGLVLDPFAGTGTTGEAAWREGMRAVLIERETEYQADIERRMVLAAAGPDERARESIKARGLADENAGPLFGAYKTQTGGGRLVYGKFARDRSGRSD